MAFFANLFRSLLKNDKEDFIEFCQRVGNERILNEYLDSFDVTSSDLFEFNGKTPNFVKLFPPIFDVYLQTKDEFPFPKTSKGVLHDLFDAQRALQRNKKDKKIEAAALLAKALQQIAISERQGICVIRPESVREEEIPSNFMIILSQYLLLSQKLKAAHGLQEDIKSSLKAIQFDNNITFGTVPHMDTIFDEVQDSYAKLRRSVCRDFFKSCTKLYHRRDTQRDPEERRTDSVSYDHTLAMTEPYFDASKILLRGRKYLNFHWPHGEKAMARLYHLIFQNKIPVIISLAEPYEKSAKKDFFWPKLGETSTYNDYREHGGFKVEVTLQSEQLRFLAVENSLEYLTLRVLSFRISYVSYPEVYLKPHTHTVTQLHLRCNEDHGEPDPFLLFHTVSLAEIIGRGGGGGGVVGEEYLGGFGVPSCGSYYLEGAGRSNFPSSSSSAFSPSSTSQTPTPPSPSRLSSPEPPSPCFPPLPEASSRRSPQGRRFSSPPSPSSVLPRSTSPLPRYSPASRPSSPVSFRQEGGVGADFSVCSHTSPSFPSPFSSESPKRKSSGRFPFKKVLKKEKQQPLRSQPDQQENIEELELNQQPRSLSPNNAPRFPPVSPPLLSLIPSEGEGEDNETNNNNDSENHFVGDEGEGKEEEGEGGSDGGGDENNRNTTTKNNNTNNSHYNNDHYHYNKYYNNNTDFSPVFYIPLPSSPYFFHQPPWLSDLKTMVEEKKGEEGGGGKSNGCEKGGKKKKKKEQEEEQDRPNTPASPPTPPFPPTPFRSISPPTTPTPSPPPSPLLSPRTTTNTTNHNNHSLPPFAVHCHGGVGRTGVFCLAHMYTLFLLHSLPPSSPTTPLQDQGGRGLENVLGKEVGLLEELFRLRLQRDSVQGPRQVAYLYHYLHCLLFLMGEKGEKREGGGEGKEGEGMYVGREYCPPCPPSKGYLTKKHQEGKYSPYDNCERLAVFMIQTGALNPEKRKFEIVSHDDYQNFVKECTLLCERGVVGMEDRLLETMVNRVAKLHPEVHSFLVNLFDLGTTLTDLNYFVTLCMVSRRYQRLLGQKKLSGEYLWKICAGTDPKSPKLYWNSGIVMLLSGHLPSLTHHSLLLSLPQQIRAGKKGGKEKKKENEKEEEEEYGCEFYLFNSSKKGKRERKSLERRGRKREQNRKEEKEGEGEKKKKTKVIIHCTIPTSSSRKKLHFLQELSPIFTNISSPNIVKIHDFSVNFPSVVGWGGGWGEGWGGVGGEGGGGGERGFVSLVGEEGWGERGEKCLEEILKNPVQFLGPDCGGEKEREREKEGEGGRFEEFLVGAMEGVVRGVEYLHERGLWHGRVCGRSVLVDMKTKKARLTNPLIHFLSHFTPPCDTYDPIRVTTTNTNNNNSSRSIFPPLAPHSFFSFLEEKGEQKEANIASLDLAMGGKGELWGGEGYFCCVSLCSPLFCFQGAFDCLERGVCSPSFSSSSSSSSSFSSSSLSPSSSSSSSSSPSLSSPPSSSSPSSSSFRPPKGQLLIQYNQQQDISSLLHLFSSITPWRGGKGNEGQGEKGKLFFLEKTVRRVVVAEWKKGCLTAFRLREL